MVAKWGLSLFSEGLSPFCIPCLLSLNAIFILKKKIKFGNQRFTEARSCER
jgi:hypothetical protein